jgi:uncharacterized membrane-anchored protein
METFLQQLTGVLLFVGLQFLVYTIYQRTNKTCLALLPNFVLLGLIVLVSAALLIFSEPNSVWGLVIIFVIIFMVVGVGFSTLVSWMMIYFIKQRKNQPNNK